MKKGKGLNTAKELAEAGQYKKALIKVEKRIRNLTRHEKTGRMTSRKRELLQKAKELRERIYEIM